MVKYPLDEVFGISTKPTLTYVDRASLDEKFKYLLERGKHIVIYGPSRTGKSWLRRKNLEESDTVLIQCQSIKSANDVWEAIGRQIGMTKPESETKTEIEQKEAHAEGGGKANFMVGAIGGKGGASKTTETEHTAEASALPGYEGDLSFLATALKKSKKRIVLEDFDFLPESVQEAIAPSLKELFEREVYVVIVSIRPVQNLLITKLGSLTDRIEEINISWEPGELDEVLKKGESLLNILFGDEFRRRIIEVSEKNVATLQDLAEKVCYGLNIRETQDVQRNINEMDVLDSVILSKANKLKEKYDMEERAFERGIKESTKHKVYHSIYKAVLRLDESVLTRGVSVHELLREINSINPRITQSNLTQALNRIEDLQSKERLDPVLVTYDRENKVLSLNDTDFLFYKHWYNAV